MKAETVKLQFKDEQVQNRSMTDKLFFCILMSITFIVYCFIYLATAPISAWEKSYNFLNKEI
ncbi:MAG: hypothetical protein ACXWEY_13670 [Bacteroidia bacterium]